MQIQSCPSSAHGPQPTKGNPLSGHFVVWHVLGFGGRANPLVFSRAASFAMRTGQALIPPNDMPNLGLTPARGQLYVDDPAFAFRGPDEDIHRTIDVLLLWWLSLGIPLSWTKGAVHDALTAYSWIGISFYRTPTHCTLELPKAYIQEVHELIKPLLKGFGAIRIKAVEQLVGKVNRIAQVVHQARPFVAALYAALTAGQQADQHRLREAPPGCMAKRRLLVGSRWIAALLKGAADAPFPLRRDVYSSPPPRAVVAGARIEFGASPWGGGAILFLQDSPYAYYATKWTEDDAPH